MEVATGQADGSGVRIQGVPLWSAYPVGATDVRVPVLFEIDMDEPILENRVPFELCVLLDRSGSMAGQKICAAKRAIHAIIDALGEQDVLHLVAYNREVETVIEGATREQAADAHALVSAITAQGGTNISAGVERAQELLANSGEGEGGKRIFLLSDGYATA